MVYPQQLTIQMRQRQLQDIYGNDIIFAGANPFSLSAVPTSIVNPWKDYTDFCQGIDKFSVTFSTIQTPTGQAEAGQFVPKKGVSDTLSFERDAYDFIKGILVEDVASPLNQIEVRVTDIASGSYTGFVIKSSQLTWCEFNSICVYELNLKQEDPYTQCIERTLIADNWQGWFQTEPTQITSFSPATTAPKYHPRFSYCVERRPNGTMVMEWYLLGVLSTVMYTLIIPLMIAITLAMNSIAFAINWIIATVNLVISAVNGLTGGSIGTITPLGYTDLDFSNITESWDQLYIESAGCGREHPAPLIRDYITNVCDKCGVRVGATTADIFFAPILSVNASDGTITNKPNPHYNACLFFPAVKRGIRRFKEIDMFGSSPMDDTTYYQVENAPVWALSDMLDYLKHLYNAQWLVRSDATGQPFLYFKRKDWFLNEPPLYDFSIGGADRHKIIEGICYTPTDYTVPASCSGLYRDDPADKCGHEAKMPMDGDPISFNNTIVNPLFHGILDKITGFGATKFRLDGASTDYIYDAAQVLQAGSWASAGLATIGLDQVLDYVRRYCDYALLLQTETVTLPKVIIWDGLVTTAPGNPYLNARALRSSISIDGTVYNLGKSAYPGTTPGIDIPDINPLYPSQVNASPTVLYSLAAPSTIPTLLPWDLKYIPKTKVLGNSVTSASPPPGKYTIYDYFGGVMSQQAAILVNYPMYFEPYYKDTMWDWFHWIDDPYKNPRLHKDWHLKIPLCKEDLQKLELLDDGSRIKLLRTILLDAKFYNSGVITEIEVCYDTGGANDIVGTGQYIQLKGFV